MSDFGQLSDNRSGSGPALAGDADFERLRARACRLTRRAGSQGDLDFDSLRAESTETAAIRDLREGVIQALKQALKECGKSRQQVLDEVQGITGIAVSAAMLDAYVAGTNPNNFPVHLAPAFCLATGSRRLLELICAAAGFYLADQRDWDLSRLAAAEIEAEKLRVTKRNLRERLLR